MNHLVVFAFVSMLWGDAHIYMTCGSKSKSAEEETWEQVSDYEYLTAGINYYTSKEEAEDICAGYGATLPRHGYDPDMYSEFEEYLREGYSDVYGIWLPIEKSANNIVWEDNGDSATTPYYSKFWASNQPDGSGDNVYISVREYNTKWDDGDGDMVVICERKRM